jgi:hypothetical protein
MELVLVTLKLGATVEAVAFDSARKRRSADQCSAESDLSISRIALQPQALAHVFFIPQNTRCHLFRVKKVRRVQARRAAMFVNLAVATQLRA